MVEFIATEEESKDESLNFVHEPAQVSGLKKSSYRKGKFSKILDQSDEKCYYCADAPHKNDSVKERRKSCKAYRTCNKCGKLHHIVPACSSSASYRPCNNVAKTATVEAVDDDAPVGALGFYNISALPTNDEDAAPPLAKLHATGGPMTTLPLPHMECYKGQWVKTASQQSPTYAVTIRLDR